MPSRTESAACVTAPQSSATGGIVTWSEKAIAEMRRAIAVSRQYFIRAVIISVLIIAALIFAARLAMPFAARRLIHSDPLVRADLIVVLGSYRLERALEAGSLFRERWSDRILLLRAPDIATSGLLRQLHLHIPVWLDIERDALVQMSVPPAMIIDAGAPAISATHASGNAPIG